MHNQSIFWKIFDSHDLVRVCLSVCVTFVSTAHILAKTKKVKKNTFEDFDICHRMTPLQML